MNAVTKASPLTRGQSQYLKSLLRDHHLVIAKGKHDIALEHSHRAHQLLCERLTVADARTLISRLADIGETRWGTRYIGVGHRQAHGVLKEWGVEVISDEELAHLIDRVEGRTVDLP
ncbi:MAG: hypothetical protein M0R37_12050 [Bacteroidales bacterium]|jgi:hypothetical protein|nr:hypothetical protein [Sphaerochaeta sp.]MCK9629307.1 hypothetical protein [Bacteroidales bacterium]